MQARAAVKGQSLVNEAAPILQEYIVRKRMASLGYTTDFSKLSALEAECFYLIDVEIEKTQAQEAERVRKRRI